MKSRKKFPRLRPGKYKPLPENIWHPEIALLLIVCPPRWPIRKRLARKERIDETFTAVLPALDDFVFLAMSRNCPDAAFAQGPASLRPPGSVPCATSLAKEAPQRPDPMACSAPRLSQSGACCCRAGRQGG